MLELVKLLRDERVPEIKNKLQDCVKNGDTEGAQLEQDELERIEKLINSFREEAFDKPFEEQMHQLIVDNPWLFDDKSWSPET